MQLAESEPRVDLSMGRNIVGTPKEHKIILGINCKETPSSLVRSVQGGLLTVDVRGGSSHKYRGEEIRIPRESQESIPNGDRGFAIFSPRRSLRGLLPSE